MPKPRKPRAVPTIELKGPLPAEVPEDVRAELGRDELPPETPAPAVPLPEDVLAEMDAEARARQLSSADPDARPVFDDDDTER
jgi:hypothetical protein